MPKPKQKPAPAGLPLSWDAAALRYRNSAGRFVARAAVLDARDEIVAATSRALRGLTLQLMDQRISLVEWQLAFKDTIKAAHTLSAGIAMGGKASMTAADWARVGSMLKVQYSALNRFALQIENGGKISLWRVELYARSVRNTFLNAERLHRPPGALARWVRTKIESCEDCIEQSGRGAQAAESFPMLGSLQCLSNCGCSLEFE